MERTLYSTSKDGFFRYIGVIRSSGTSKFSTIKAVKIQLAAVVIFSVIVEISRYFEYKVVEKTCNNHTFYLRREQEFVDHDLYDILYTNIIRPLFRRYLPLIITTIPTFLLIKFLILTKTTRRGIFINHGEHSNIPIDHITKVLVVIAVMYILCLTPGAIYPIVRLFVDTGSCDSVYNYFIIIADLLAIVNSSLNFFVYYLNIPSFRESLKSTLRKCCGRRNVRDAYAVETPSTRM